MVMATVARACPMGDDLQRVAQRLDLVLAGHISEQVKLQGAAGARLAHEGNYQACWEAMRATVDMR